MDIFESENIAKKVQIDLVLHLWKSRSRPQPADYQLWTVFKKVYYTVAAYK